MKGILGRIMFVVGAVGIVHQACLFLYPEIFTRALSIPMAEYNPETRTASYRSSMITLDIQLRPFDLVPGPDDRLIIERDGEVEEVPIAIGTPVEIGGELYTIKGMQRWRGLLPDLEGEPMAQVSLGIEGEEWVEGIQLNERAEAKVEDLTVVFRNNLNTEAKPYQHRWGVVDDGSVVWFDDIQEGAGYQTKDDTNYTLAGYREKWGEEGRPAIVVIEQHVAREPKRHVVTLDDEHPIIKLDVPDPDVYELVLQRRGMNAVFGVLYKGSKRLAWLNVKEGEIAEIGSTPYRMRLEQVEDAAVPVSEDEAIFEIVLTQGDKRMVVRQGEAVRADDEGTILRYRLDTSLARVKYTVYSPMLDEPLDLNNGDAVFAIATDIGMYRATPHAARNGETLTVNFTPFASIGVVIASIFMIIAGGTFVLMAHRELSSRE